MLREFSFRPWGRVPAGRRVGVVGLRSCATGVARSLDVNKQKDERRIKGCSGVISINLIDLCTFIGRATPDAPERNYRRRR